MRRRDGLFVQTGCVGHEPAVDIARIYDSARRSGTTRVLVDRLWPRGFSRERADLDLWCRDVAPTRELRDWYRHDPPLFAEFERRYRAELAQTTAKAALAVLVERYRAGPLTLLTASKVVDISHASVLAKVLREG